MLDQSSQVGGAAPVEREGGRTRLRPVASADLAAIPSFAGIEERVLDATGEGGAITQHGDREPIFSEGQTPTHLCFVRRGIVELFGSMDGQESTVALVWAPDPLAPAGTISGGPYLVSARSFGACEVLRLPAAPVLAAARKDAALAWRFAELLAAQSRWLQRTHNELRARSAPQRLGAFLYRLVRDQGESGCADLPVPKYALASRLGMTPESVSRALPVLRDHGMVVRGTRVLLRDVEKFERFCRLDPLLDGREPRLLLNTL